MSAVTAVYARLLHASACRRRHRPGQAYESLCRALEDGFAERIVRPFLEVPGAVTLLDQFIGRFGHFNEFADEIRKHPAADRSAAAPRLTGKEMSVLQQLPSGLTADRIAADMGVSVNTVKTHLRGIYHKLGVGARADAITRARTHGLI
ncbi:response regulator transcription factor [Nocardia sp. 2]|uniref:Response regulator transcription factor n=2 Tax=Nocardia acididurans TaxID=2802282 RepID=A0ABS1M2M9_9NOCA|nr:response regulator transcription factor [Nocardia acididurans]